MLLALILAAVSILLLCWLVYTLATLALPLFVAATLGHWAFSAGAGLLEACFAGFAAGALSLFTCQVLLASSRSVGIRTGVIVLFATPAAIAGFSAAHSFAAMGGASATLRILLGLAGGISVALSSVARLSAATGEAPHSELRLPYEPAANWS
ncbi:MAG: hypothetical protein E6Q40_05365 [Cupriavidus sp.]|nr:MAG: hypothetical protein E6Q40_05365 [Cupriavidus sp.]